ncbi:hypothetical protein P280DRAFT_466350 [Massarina eburnea CBS 473.64]|uniref:Secreted protein n=1 Tax=Massarina eburnea CBS 473.64 TaxID=1395130 RepID=A0A6A6SFV6_9PLEO|nr:hypothetical protein P280DRAFT_466350 [Massarina eburnea CBS 473.64]
MQKPTSLRLLLTLLLLIQACCWALTLLDLFQPGKPLLMLRDSTNTVSQLFQLFSTRILSATPTWTLSLAPPTTWTLVYRDMLIHV